MKVDPATLDDDELRDMLKFIQEKKTSPQRRRADAKRQSNKLSGKDSTSKLLEGFM